MKRFIFTLISIFLVITNYKGQTGKWEVLNEGKNIKTISFIDALNGYLLGDHSLMKTDDGGQTWFEIYAYDSVNFHELCFINNDDGWAVTKEEVEWKEWQSYLYRTCDGGITWTKQSTHDGQIDILHGLNDSNIFAIGEKIVIKTNNGGSDWVDITPPLDCVKLTSILFIDPDNGLLLGKYDLTENSVRTERGAVFKTDDGGNTWQESLYNQFTEMSNLQFTNDSTTYFIADKHLYKSSDTLTSWIRITNDMIPNLYFDHYYFLMKMQ